MHLWSPQFTTGGDGITAFSRELARAEAAEGTRPRLFAKADRSGSWEGLRLTGSGGFPPAARTAAFAARAVAAAVKEGPDWIVSTHLHFGPAARMARSLSRGIRYALVAHGIEVRPDLPEARLAALRAADRILAVSRWTRGLLEERCGIDPARVAIVPNTYDEERYVPGAYPDHLAARYGIAAGEKVVLSVARLDSREQYKGCDRVIEALAEVRRQCGPVRYLLAGRGDDRPRLEALADSLGLAESVTFAGFVPDEELADHYRLADAFAMPSTGEGFGIVFLEALGCGTPVLGGHRDGSRDALDDGRLGRLVDPLSIAGIAGGLIELLEKKGPAEWYQPAALSQSVRAKYGRDAFRRAWEMGHG